MTPRSSLTADELADGICLRAGRIAAAEAELLAWIGEFDERGGWGGHGILSCAHWLSWKTGLSPGAAREKVRVAKALRELPAVAEAFGQGLMSWSQVLMKMLPGRNGTVRLRPLTAADLRRFDLGRSQRDVSASLRELDGTIDGERCRFRGCTRHKKLHAHHVVHWSEGGATDFDNLVLVCSRHHTLIHSQGFRLVLHHDRRLDVTTAEGVQLLHLPPRPWGDPAALDPAGRINARTITPPHFEPRMDLGYVVGVLLA